MSPMQVLLSLLICATVAFAIDVKLVMEKHNQIVRTMLRTQNLLSRYEMRMTANASSEISFDETPIEPSAGTMEACYEYIELQHAQTAATYQKQAELCDKIAADARAELWKRSNETREALMRHSDAACENRKRCENLSDNNKFFVCYSEMSAAAVLNLNNISLIASGQVDDESKRHREIDLTSNRCSTDAEYGFTSTSEMLNKEIEACILGKFTPPGYESDDSSSESPDHPADSLELVLLKKLLETRELVPTFPDVPHQLAMVKKIGALLPSIEKMLIKLSKNKNVSNSPNKSDQKLLTN